MIFFPDEAVKWLDKLLEERAPVLLRESDRLAIGALLWERRHPIRPDPSEDHQALCRQAHAEGYAAGLEAGMRAAAKICREVGEENMRDGESFRACGAEECCAEIFRALAKREGT